MSLQRVSSWLTFLAASLPWLNPFFSGPTPGAVPWLFSLACAGFIVWTSGRASGRIQFQNLTQAIAVAWLAAALLSAVLGLLQYFGSNAVLGPWVNNTHVGEAFANLRQRNHFATLTNIGLAALLLQIAAHQFPSGVYGLPVLVASMLLVAGNAASSSRTGLVQLAGVIALAWFWSNNSQLNLRITIRRTLCVAALGYACCAVALPIWAGLDWGSTGILTRFQAGDAPCSSRVTLWSNVLHLIAQKPFLGWGWGELGYAHFITQYPRERFCDILNNAHNLPLHLAVELGIPVALSACGASLWLVWRAKPWREGEPSRQMAWTVLALILLHSMLEYPLWYGPFQMAFGISIWMLIRSQVQTSGKYKQFRSLAPNFHAQVAIVFIALCSYSAWDYWRISQIYRSPASRASGYRENTLEKIQGTWLFQNQVRFAELNTTPLTSDNAAYLNAMAKALLHFSAEASVVEILIESAVILGKDDEAMFYLARYRVAFPANLARWVELRERVSNLQ